MRVHSLTHRADITKATGRADSADGEQKGQQ